MIIDSHCHLDRLQPDSGQDVDDLLVHARECGVGGFLCVGIAIDTMPAMMSLVEKHDDVYASVGTHPLENAAVIQRENLREWAAKDEIVAVGETGLDYHYQPDTAADQQENFRIHLDIASEVGKPVIVHTREAEDDTLAALRNYRGDAGGVLHCFTGSLEMAKQALDLGLYISLSGIVTFRNADELRKVAKQIPVDRLLVETDAPYLAPVPYRGKSNQPAYVIEVARFLAELRGEDYDAFAERTTENFFRLFSLAAAS